MRRATLPGLIAFAAHAVHDLASAPGNRALRGSENAPGRLLPEERVWRLEDVTAASGGASRVLHSRARCPASSLLEQGERTP